MLLHSAQEYGINDIKLSQREQKMCRSGSIDAGVLSCKS